MHRSSPDRGGDARGSRWRVVLPLVVVLVAGVAEAQGADPLFGRVQRLVNNGNRAAARALADSALQVRTPGTMAHAEALFARAYATSDAAAAERDYVRVSIEYPFSPRAEEAILMVGQFRLSRGDRAGARAQYDRLAREFPQSEQSARSNYWAGRLALEDGDIAPGCAFLFVASERVGADDVELRNQIEYLRNRCKMPEGVAPATDPQRPDSTSPREERPDAAGPAAGYSVQVAAYQRKRDADALAGRLRARGFQVRVVGASAPYRVRVGRYATRAEAVAAQGRMRRAGVRGIVVDAEPR